VTVGYVRVFQKLLSSFICKCKLGAVVYASYEANNKGIGKIGIIGIIGIIGMMPQQTKYHEIEKKAPVKPELSSRSDFLTCFVVVVRISF
jgi:hypothetical protein